MKVGVSAWLRRFFPSHGQSGSNFARLGRAVTLEHHDPVMLFPASAHSKKCRKKKKTVSVAVSYSEIAIAVLPRRLGRLQKLAFLQERDDRFPTSGAK